MEIAVRTAGKGQKAEYAWKSNSDSDCGDRIRFIESMCGQGHGCALVRRLGIFDAYFSGFKSGLEDYRQRNIVVTLVFLGISETTARALTLLFTEDYDSFKEILLDTFSRASSDEWTVDYDKFSRIAEVAERQANLHPQAPPFDEPRADDFDGKADSSELDSAKNQRSIKRLCQEIRDYRFSDGDGLKLLLAATHPQAGYERALVEADRLLWAEGSKDDLAASRKKKAEQATSPTQSRKSRGPSDWPSQTSQYLDLSKEFSNSLNSLKKSFKKSPIIWVVGISVVSFAVGYLRGGANAKKERQQAVEQARKEKDQEWEAKNAKNTEELRELKVKNAAPAQAPN